MLVLCACSSSSDCAVFVGDRGQAPAIDVVVLDAAGTPSASLQLRSSHSHWKHSRFSLHARLQFSSDLYA
jgi:hypothetical protein